MLCLTPSHLSEEGNQLANKHCHLEGVLFATSGTTGRPKWVLHSEEGLNWCAQTVNEHFACSSQDVWALALPTFHVGGYCLARRATLAGGKLAQFRNKWNPKTFCDWLKSERATLTSLVPTQIFDLVQAQLPPPAPLRVVIVGGEHLDTALFTRALELGWPLALSYGMTETAGVIAISQIGQPKLQPMPGWQIDSNSENQLTVNGPGLFRGYLSEIGLQPPPLPFVTNDLVSLRENTLTIEGRNDDHIKILGELVNLATLRKGLAQQIPHHRTTLLALPDKRRGYQLVPVIESEKQANLITECKHWNTSLPAFARCLEPVFLRHWPRTTIGKVDFGTLTQQVADEQDSLLPRPPLTD